VRAVGELADVRIDHAYIGSCASGTLAELRAAASLLAGRRVHAGVQLLVIPATRRIYEAAMADGTLAALMRAGAQLAPPTCGPCFGGLAQLDAGEVRISTSTATTRPHGQPRGADLSRQCHDRRRLGGDRPHHRCPRAARGDRAMSGMSTGLVLAGRCWRLGDDVSSDALISAGTCSNTTRGCCASTSSPRSAGVRHGGPAGRRARRRQALRPRQSAQPSVPGAEGDGVGLVARTLSRPAFRLAIYMGVPLLEVGEEVPEHLGDGDRLRVDFSAGAIANESRGVDLQVEPLPAFLLEIVAAGGGLAHLKQQHAAA
jgi:hypothetical protein